MEKRAITFRERNELTHSQPINFQHLLKKLGVVTLFKEMDAGVAGMAIKVDEFRFMLINSAMNLGRQNFTICHELYHLYEQEEFESEICNTELFSKKHKEEYNADFFASYLLLPNDGVMGLIPEDQLGKDKLKIATLIEIGQKFTCSNFAVLIRLKDLGLISDDYVEANREGVAKKAAELKYPTDLYFPARKDTFFGDDYVSVMKTAFQAGILKEVSYISYLKDVGISEI